MSAPVTKWMAVKGIISVSFALAAVVWVFYVCKTKLDYFKCVPDDLIWMSIIGVLIYIGCIAAGKVQKNEYRPLEYIPEYLLRFSEAPVFTTVTYVLILQNNPTLNNPGTLLAVSLFIGMFTRNFEEFFKLLGESILKPMQHYYDGMKQNSTPTSDTSPRPSEVPRTVQGEGNI